MNDIYKITGGPESNNVKVFGPDGKEIKGIIEIEFLSILPMSTVKMRLTVLADLDMEVNVARRREWWKRHRKSNAAQDARTEDERRANRVTDGD